MPLVTECPKCRTLFKVVRDQLKISDGWVRCGQCGEIFDTAINLREWVEKPSPESTAAVAPAAGASDKLSPEATVPEAATAAGPAIYEGDGREPREPVPAQDAPDLVADSTAHLLPSSGTVASITPDAPPSDALMQSVSVPDAQAVSLPGQELTFVAAEPGDAGNRSRRSKEQRSRRRNRRVESAARTAGEVQGLTDAERSNYAEVSFMRKRAGAGAPGHAKRQGPLWTIAILLLVWLLCAQWAWHEREMFAAWSPSVRSGLVSVCERLGCTVEPLRRIEFLTVDSSSFNKNRVAGYLLSFTVRNQFNLDLARPSIELTLTDAADKPVYRKVLLAQDLHPESSMLAAGDEWSVVLPVHVPEAAGSAARGGKELTKPVIVGYRLLAFYP